MNKTQGFFNLAYRYTRALSRWIKAGRPVRSEEEIKRIFENCCKPCEDYEEGTCRHCGCYVNLLKSARQNKIAMATEECPLNKWNETNQTFTEEMTMNKTTDKTTLTATRDNTVFVSVAAWSDYESKTATFRKSAADHEVPFVFCDIGETWQGFYHHKIKRMSEHLRRFREEGKHFAFVLDCRDLVFIEHVDSILTKFNALHEGRVIFNHDTPGKVWPSHKEYLANAMEEAMGSEHARLNAGALAGSIETILKIQHYTMELRRELEEGCPRSGILEKLHQDIGTKHINDDQHLYQVCLTYYPELFQIDYDKALFAVLKSYPKEIREHSDDPKRHDVINNAAIIHSPWLSHGHNWNDWAVRNRWER